ncbi:transcriptional repressor [bacterium]|nr:transcriptional repressor [bacterium]MBU1614620.1 transcriptional repressor [bacterium]
MIRAQEKFRDYLKEKRLKFTPERQVVLKEVFSLQGHFDVEDIFVRLKGKGRFISRATIYRTFPLLLSSGLIKEAVGYQNRTCFERAFGHDHHDHLVCLKCGAIIEFKDEKIKEAQDTICKRYEFTQIEHKLGIKGYCKKCR